MCIALMSAQNYQAKSVYFRTTVTVIGCIAIVLIRVISSHLENRWVYVFSFSRDQESERESIKLNYTFPP